MFCCEVVEYGCGVYFDDVVDLVEVDFFVVDYDFVVVFVEEFGIFIVEFGGDWVV